MRCVNGIYCAQCACTIKMWVGIFRLNILWSCSINSWLDVILKYTVFSSLLLCLVTKVCRQVLFEWIVWTAWIVLTVYSPSLHWRWVCQGTFCGVPVVHTLAVPWERQERGCKSQLCKSVLPALIQNDADWNTEDKKQKNTFKNNVGFFLVFFSFCT